MQQKVLHYIFQNLSSFKINQFNQPAKMRPKVAKNQELFPKGSIEFSNLFPKKILNGFSSQQCN